MSKKMNWAEVDKRIRDRRPTWTKDERETLEKQLARLPDLEAEVDYVDIPQPALAPRDEATEPSEGEEQPPN